ncbi:MAG: ParB/RepB/Spo0J family partition protein [Thermogemmatispora sp.]|uniref:ParB/RepB/Spo0J family partition protein n=1 Tax=Thermogemmatispora sp. TaxID=1968838 RepID=UPI0026103DE1|nr:ParB/RepB/Spo0J family partition protein [Thermogemmatispora sp.]MBX5458339.1 ParB/RepB/Spo0J family partition protein [Thermogemmatispora sp.]
MVNKKSPIGRGLDVLFSGSGASPAPAAETPAARQPVPRADAEGAIQLVPIDSILPNPRQPRRICRDDDPALLELSASIKEHGLLQPLIVTRLEEESTVSPDPWASAPDDDPWAAPAPASAAQASTAYVSPLRYQLIAGERRWRAARLAGLSQVPVIVKEASPQQMLELALIENVQRADLNPIEEALAYQTLAQEFGLTHEQIAERVGKQRTTITNTLRLLNLAPAVRERLLNPGEHFTEGHARAIAGLSSYEDQEEALHQVLSRRLTVRETEELVRGWKSLEQPARPTPSRSTPVRSPDLEELETQFRNSLMVKVDLRCNARGKGTIVLHFNNQEELERLYARLVKNEVE